MPDLSRLDDDVAEYAAAHARALRSGDHHGRAIACWGLVARGRGAIDWVMEGLDGDDPERVEDAGGVLRWIGIPAELVPALRSRAEGMPEGAGADALLEA